MKLIMMFLLTLAMVGCMGDPVPTVQLADVPGIPPQVRISWEAPTTYTDESYLSPGDIGGFKIYRGSNIEKNPNYSDLVLIVEIIDGSSTSYIDANVVQGEYYFYAATCFDIRGSESDYSDLVSIEIQ